MQGRRNKDVGNNEDTNYKVLYFGTATTTGWSPASVSATAVTTTIDTMSRPTPSTHRPLTTLLLGLDEDSDVPSTFSIDPDTALSTLSW